MDLGLKGKRAIVLGGSRGIGRSIALAFADEGAHVALCARGQEGVTHAVKEVEGRGVGGFGRAVDLADSTAVGDFVAASAEALGGVDMLVSSASALNQGNKDEQWHDMLQIDVLGLNAAFYAARPWLEEAANERGDASITAISSVSAVNGNQPAAYGAMKAALIHVMKGYAKTLAPKKIRANVVSPGTIYFKGGVWNLVEENMPDVYKASLARNPLGRMGKPEEIADAAVFLASPRSAFTTGANLIVDGALTDRVNF